MEEEQEMINHFTHGHPLTWIPSMFAETQWNSCMCCGRYFEDGDAGYRCRNKCAYVFLHEDCAEMPGKIRHPLHPSHLLTLNWWYYLSYLVNTICRCAVCEKDEYGLIYFCSSWGCKWWIHLRCAASGGGLVAFDHEPGKQVMNHPSHPEHEMRLLRREKRSCSFKCDACGTTEKGNSYICIICEYWIHESCAALPTTVPFHHHHHSLSLAFHLPDEYIINDYNCGICDRALGLRNWVYHCELCRYVVHIKCATNTSPAASSTSICNENVGDDHKVIIKFPLNDIYEEIIKPFVKRERGDMCIPHEDISEKYEFYKHHHPLSLITFSRSSTHDQIEEEEEEDEDEDEDDDPRSEIKCDGCTTHIHQNYKKSSSTSSYLSCDDCKYFLHLACFNLPQELSSHPLHEVKDHKLKLQYFGKLTHDYWPFCSICRRQMNGLYYACTICKFELDIKCASLPETIKHNAHPQDHHYLNLVTDKHKQYQRLIRCVGCHNRYSKLFYRCDSCKFSMCGRCVFLPEANKHGLMEKHRLPLTYDAHVNHPSEFYCGSCEEKMYPKRWMYYCRKCDESFHPECFPTTSGNYMNINFGTEHYYVSHHPHHPLRFQVITKKQCCDVCRHVAYDNPGFQCVSCNFVMCLDRCGREHMGGVKVIKSQ